MSEIGARAVLVHGLELRVGAETAYRKAGCAALGGYEFWAGGLASWSIAESDAESHLRAIDGITSPVRALTTLYNGMRRFRGLEAIALGQRIMATRTAIGEEPSAIVRAAHPWTRPDIKPAHPLYGYLPYDFNVYLYWEPPFEYAIQRIVNTPQGDRVLEEFMGLSLDNLIEPPTAAETNAPIR